ncbi:MAG: hypothetical protein NC301_07480 [Bacteroides sp.]|nr:hypothetical protein [Bacteroides sp.]MCM1379992.1 hypothetical protein [Bacteroides sp.]MCM1446328.1 hypothetical protein [Prevotella sp.]
MVIYVDLENYLKQWFVHRMGGQTPVRPMRGSIEYNILERYLTTPPVDYVPDLDGEGRVAIELPNFRSKDTRDNFYLPPRAAEFLKSTLRESFDVDLWTEINTFTKQTRQIKENIYAFMESHGIEATGTNWDAIKKRYDRKRAYYLKLQRGHQKSSQKSSQH